MRPDLHRQSRWAWLASTLGGALLLLTLASGAMAQGGDVRSYTYTTFTQWLEKYRDAKPDFKAGDVLTSKDLARMAPFVPPGYLEQLDFPEFKATIIAPVNHRPRQDYINCTEKYQNQVRLADDDALENYVCGQPFANSSISVDDPRAGIKVAWNFNWRWMHYGLSISDVVWVWDRFDGGTHVAPATVVAPPYWNVTAPLVVNIPMDMTPMLGGRGTFERVLQGPYKRAYYSHLAPLNGGALDIPHAKDFEFKEFTGFYSPFDIRGTAFIIYRYADPHRADDAWAYIPTLRRVRRISAEVKYDSLLGTDDTLDDFYGFAGRNLEWTWKFLGWKDVLTVMDSKWLESHFYGPKGIIPDDVWSLRRMAVIARTPKDPRNPYLPAVNFWDMENYDTFYELAWDHKGKLWKVWEFQKKWTESYDEPSYQAINKGVYTTNFQSAQVLDLQNNRGTAIPCMGAGYPLVVPSQVESIMDINKLEQIHR